MTSSAGHLPHPSPPATVEPHRSESPLAGALQATERISAADGVVRAVESLTARLDQKAPAILAAERGGLLGHPLHPVVNDLPLGLYTSALVLDRFPDGRESARRLILLGLLTTPAAALTGWAEVDMLPDGMRRSAVVHGGLNGAASVVFLVSYLCRRKDANDRGARALALLGGSLLGLGAALGGHVAHGRPAAASS